MSAVDPAPATKTGSPGPGGREGWRLIAATALLVGWLLLLWFGHPFGAVVHLLLLAALAVTPWRLLRP